MMRPLPNPDCWVSLQSEFLLHFAASAADEGEQSCAVLAVDVDNGLSAQRSRKEGVAVGSI